MRCNLWAAPSGADTNPGTKASPLQSLDRLAKSLAPGQTGCLVPGSTFGQREVITASGKAAKGRITITTGPGGPRAVLANGIETTQATRYLTLANLELTAANSSVPLDVSGTVILRGYSTALTGSRVGPGSLKEAGRSCVVLEHARAAVIQGNVLHDCDGASPGQYGAGVLASISVGARIVGNVIYGNAGGDGIAFSPNAQLSVARRNLIVDNGGGIYFGGDTRTASRGNRVEQNVIARSGKVVVHSAFPGGSPVRSGNVVPRQLHLGLGRADGFGHRFHDVREPEGQPARGRAEARRLPAVVLEPVRVHHRQRRVDERQRHSVRLEALYRPGSAPRVPPPAMLYDPPATSR